MDKFLNIKRKLDDYDENNGDNKRKKTTVTENIKSGTQSSGASHGAPAMTGKFKGFVSRLKQDFPNIISTHCFIHHEALMIKSIPDELKNVLNLVIKMVNYIKSRALKTQILKKMCEEAGSRYEVLVLHTEIQWLSKGKVLNRFYEMKNELLQLFNNEDPNGDFVTQLNNPLWSAKLAYLADIFNNLNILNSNMQGKDENILRTYFFTITIFQNYPKTLFEKQNRSFSDGYFNQYSWLEYSIKIDAVFCFCCRIFNTNNIYIADNTFTKTGFRNWKKLSGNGFKLMSHEKSKYHLKCMASWSGYLSAKSIGSVVTQVSAQNKKEIIENRNYLKQIIDIVLYLTRQGISFRGHDETKDSLNQGNFKEACQLMAKHDIQFKIKQESKFNFTSPDIQNELINVCSDVLKTNIISQIKSVGFFAIMVDDARCHKVE